VISQESSGRIIAALRNVSLADLKTVANSEPLRLAAISGQVNAAAEAAWTGSMNNLVVRADATTSNAQIAPAHASTNSVSLPLKAVIHARYAGATQEMALNQSCISTPQTSINLNGTVSNRSVLQIRVQSNDLHEVETALICSARPRRVRRRSAGSSRHGFVQWSRAIQSAPTDRGQLNASNVRIRGLPSAYCAPGERAL
jgi:autotransporter translocation and assembly factor TamB